MDIVNISIIFYIFWTTLCLSSWEKRKEWLSLIHITTVQTDQLDETPKGFVKFNNFLIIIFVLIQTYHHCQSIHVIDLSVYPCHWSVCLSMPLICLSIHAIDLSVYPCHWSVSLSMPLICQSIHAIDLSVYPCHWSVSLSMSLICQSIQHSWPCEIWLTFEAVFITQTIGS